MTLLAEFGVIFAEISMAIDVYCEESADGLFLKQADAHFRPSAFFLDLKSVVFENPSTKTCIRYDCLPFYLDVSA